jgi:RNA polymerase sigma-70 factor (ECF subfamily)
VVLRPKASRRVERGLDGDIERLIARFQAGDDSAFDAIYSLYRYAVHAYLNKVFNDHHQAEDGTHDVLLKALTMLPTFEMHAPFRVWLFRVARNYALDYLAKHVRLEYAEPRELDRHRENRPAEESSSEMLLEGGEALTAVEALPSAQRQVVVLRFLIGCRPEEIATITGRTENAVHQLQKRALTTLRTQLKPDNPGETSSSRMAMRAHTQPGPVLRARRLILTGH